MVADRYRVVSFLGRGGMGEVYGADDLKLGQRVALKFLPSDRGKSSSWREQLYAEVRMARQVSHPNVCRVYDVGESEDRLFLSMEFVDGEDLASLLRRIGRLPDDKAVEVAQQLCAGLTAAHRSGVLHRDLKPANVMIDGNGRARVMDFGLAIAASEAGRKYGPTGTLGYLAPELLDGAAPSVQSDLYALGAVLYELFTGKKAFDAGSPTELRRQQSETALKPPSSVIKNFDPAIEGAILRCLDHDPAQRPGSALGVAAALPGGDPLSAALAAGETPSPEMVAAAGPQGSLRPVVAWSYFAAAVVLIVGTSMFLAPQATDWGLASMNKSPEVLADRAGELAKKLGYPSVVDRAFWIGSEKDYFDYVEHHLAGKDWTRLTERQAWPSLDRIIHEGLPITTFKVLVPAFLVLSVIFGICPRAVDTRATSRPQAWFARLCQARQPLHRGVRRQVGALRKAPGEPLLGTADIQSLADLGGSFERIQEMSIAPITKGLVIQFVVMAVLCNAHR